MLNIVKLKGCQRCGGDLFLERDYEEAYIICLQCSAIYNRRRVPRVKKLSPRKIYAR